MACCGDVPTLETLAAVSILHERLPDLEDPRGQRRLPLEIGMERITPIDI
jgi:hypothetical protein